VFTTEFGEPCDPRNALRALKAAATKAGLPAVRLHTLRHSAASVMLIHGVPLKVVSEILGHSSIAITVDGPASGRVEVGWPKEDPAIRCWINR
jgi:site-specific recombinase XerD